jgi:hypothetical protein
VRAAIIALSIVLTGQGAAHATCGDRGGPGYRGPDGKCVGWVSIAHICGCTLPGRCTAEEPAPEAQEAATLGCKIRKLGHLN